MIASEEEARAWVAGLPSVSRETLVALERFSHIVTEENDRQNLVSASTLPHIWRRHIADSAQLLLGSHSPHIPWLDIGTGAGFPGLVVALLHGGPVTLVEPRKLRAAFLRRAAEAMGITPTIVDTKVQHLPASRPFGIISARAVAPLTDLLALAHPYSTEKTRLIFPKGRNAQSELAAAQRAWQGSFRSEPSLTDPEARIVIVEGLRPRRPRKGT